MGAQDDDDDLDVLVRMVSAIARNPVRSEQLGGLVQLRSTCEVCLAPVEGYPRCFQCNRHREIVDETDLADLIIPLSYAIQPGSHAPQRVAQYYSDLYSYKNYDAGAAKLRLKIMIYLFAIKHWQCLERKQGRVSLITSVPSGQGRSPHPLEEIRAQLQTYAPIIDASYVGQPRSGRAADMNPDDFSFPRQLAGHVLIVEDAWFKGNNAQAVAVKAKRMGAERVTILVLGRVLNLGFDVTRAWVESTNLANQQWDPDDCPVGA